MTSIKTKQEEPMTDIKKTEKGKSAVKAKKLQLNKETIKDLDTSKTAAVRGGARNTGGPSVCCGGYCSLEESGCIN